MERDPMDRASSILLGKSGVNMHPPLCPCVPSCMREVHGHSVSLRSSNCVDDSSCMCEGIVVIVIFLVSFHSTRSTVE